MTFHNSVMLVCNVQYIIQIHQILTELIASCYHSYSNFNGHEHLYLYSGVPNQAAIWFSIKTENQWQSKNLLQLKSDLKHEMKIFTFSITETASKATIYLKGQIFSWVFSDIWTNLLSCKYTQGWEHRRTPRLLPVTPIPLNRSFLTHFLAPVVNRILSAVHSYSPRGKR